VTDAGTFTSDSAWATSAPAPADCRSTIAEVIDAHGRLDVLVKNAGITMDKTVAGMTEDDWHGVLAVNLSGAFFQLAKFGKRTDDGIGIALNTVTPGLITTEMTADIPEKVMARLTSQIRVGRAGRPEEIACVVHFLAADASPTSPGSLERQRRHGHVSRGRIRILDRRLRRYRDHRVW
jgi:NAD(P)-dependent dehydrogenase (short-subunit alcohol dehydrogenase family)